MVRIRLRRMGSKRQPSYRVVVADSRKPRDGGFIEVIGLFNPRTEPESVQIVEERALYWLKVGAQPSDAVARLLDKVGTTERFARLKQGEALETLVAEAQAVEKVAISPKTRIERAPHKAAEPAAAEMAEGSADAG